MIKILHIGHSRKWRGGENQVRLLIQGMNERQFDAQHYIAYPQGAIMIERLAGEVNAVLHLSSGQPIDPRSVRGVVQFCKKHNVDIIDAHSGSAHSLAFYAKQFLPDVKLIVHRRVNFKVKRSFFTRKKYLSEKIDHYVAISSAIQQNLVGYGVNQARISLVKSAVDATPYLGLLKHKSKKIWCEHYGWDPQQPLLGFAAALDPSKDPILFVQIIKALRNKGNDVNALIAGRGKLENELQKEIQKAGLDEWVKLTGFIENMPELFCAFDIFFLPSREEGLGTVLLEAIHSGCVMVASDVGGIGEIVRHRETGMLANSGDINGFANVTQELLDSGELCAELKVNATEHVSQSFSLDKLLDNNYQVYRQVMGQLSDR